MIGPKEILAYWLDEAGPKGWYTQSAEMDAHIRATFEATWDAAMEGKFSFWLTYPSGALAYIILTDQFSRNMFRGTAKAFASDSMALAVAKSAIAKGWDLKIDEPARQFFYLPLMHSECLSDQERCVRLMCDRMSLAGDDNLKHARAHRQVIREFGRFPYRNDALSRTTTGAEAAYLAQGGYGATVRATEARLAG